MCYYINDMKKNIRQNIKYIFAYLYLILGYLCFIYVISYNIRIANKPEGWAVLLFLVLLCFIVYTAINHIFIRRIISNKLLIFIEALLFFSMFTLVISDVMYEQYVHLKYIQRTQPIIVTPYNEL